MHGEKLLSRTLPRIEFWRHNFKFVRGYPLLVKFSPLTFYGIGLGNYKIFS